MQEREERESMSQQQSWGDDVVRTMYNKRCEALQVVPRNAAPRRVRLELTFKVLKQICYSISFIVEQERLVVCVPRGATSAATADVTHSLSCRNVSAAR